MYYLLSNKEYQKPEKFTSLDSIQKKSGRNGKGEQKFENGCIYIGEFVDDMFHGNGEFLFPEGTILTGLFEQNHFRKGTISLSVGIKIICHTETDYDTFEDFFKDFKVVLTPDCFLTCTTNAKGHLDSAQVVSKNVVLANYQNVNLVFKIPNETKNYLIVSRLWFYIGEIMNFSSEHQSGPIFDGCGNQVWYTGIGYNQGSRLNGQLHGEQNMLRHCAGLQFFRSMNYTNGNFDTSVSVFNSGLIFITEEDYFKGTLRVMLQNGETREFECSLNDYSSLKAGVLKFQHDDIEIKMFEKGNRLMFNWKGQDYNLDEFKIMLS